MPANSPLQTTASQKELFMKKAWEFFPHLTSLVFKMHEGVDCGHHPPEHALIVAQYALMIAEDENIGKLAAIAALLHNTDRLTKEEHVESTVRTAITTIQAQTLDFNLSHEEIETIVQAVMNHHKKNDPEDSDVLVCLKDADRLGNISPFEIAARSARAYPTLRLVDPRYVNEMDPTSTYRDPKSVFRDAVLSTLEWETWLRLPKAIGLARKYFDGLRTMQKLTYWQFEETGLTEFANQA